MLSKLRLVTLLALAGCATTDLAPNTGSISLSLAHTTEEAQYRLENARFSLEGPVTRDLASQGEDTLDLELPQGAYQLELLDGWAVVRTDASTGEETVETPELVSENPVSLLIEAEQTTRVAFRFELTQAPSVEPPTGSLQIGFEVETPLTTAPLPDCASGLTITEIDYDQTGADDGEFIEILGADDCAADLAEVTLELVNGGDGETYARYALADASQSLAAGERLVIGDAAILETLEAATPRLPLSGSGLQNGPDGVILRAGDRIVDQVAYEEALPGVGEGRPTLADADDRALARCPDGFDGGDNLSDFAQVAPTPGAPNACSGEAPLEDPVLEEVGDDTVEP